MPVFTDIIGTGWRFPIGVDGRGGMALSRYTDEIEGRYADMRCPTRLLWGVEDQWIPLERGRELARRIPGCALTEVPDCGHLMQEDAPEAVVSAAFAFFD